jgi:drug/metabolite transporter (DMT)-like permease|tara:strand:- start:193 stop:1065 length:873 start_codon:yes stop_codon:yes gene_type:complete
LLFLATLGWGSNTIASRLAVGEVSPMLLIFFRWGFVVVILLSLYWRQMIDEWPIIRPRLKWLLIMGGCGLSLFNAFFYIAAHSTTAVNLGIIQSTMPGMILLGSFMFFGDRINRLQFSGLLLTLLGVGVIVTQGSLEQLMQLTFNHGDLLMIFACSFYAMYTVGLKSRPKISGMVMLAYFSVAAFLMTIPLMIFESFIYGTVMPGVKGFAIVFYIAIVPSFLSQIFFMRGVDLIGPGSAGLYANLVPIFSAIMAVLLLSEEFALFHLASMLLVFGGIGLFEYQGRRKVSS